MPQPLSADSGRAGVVRTLVLAATIAAGLAATVWIFHPGVMTYDALYVYQSIAAARHGDWQSPLMAVVWRWIDPLAPGAASMFGLAAALYWAGFGAVALTLARTRPALAFVVPLLALSPPAIVLVGVIWRDVPFAACWLLAAALAFASAGGRWPVRLPLQAAAVGLCAAGVLLRPNALLAAPLLAAYLLWPDRFLVKRAAIACLPLMAALFVLVQVIYYGVLGAEHQHPLHALFVFDLGGITHFAGVNAFPVAWTAAQERLLTTSCYDPMLWDVYWNREPCRFVMDRLETQDRLFGTPALTRAWLTAIVAEPVAYLQHRATVFARFLFGNNVVVWFGDLGDGSRVIRADEPVFMAFKAMHDALKATPVFRTATWLAAAIAVVVLAWRRRTTPPGAFAVAVGGAAAIYVLTFFVVGVAADYRYGYWATLASLAGAAALTARPTAAS